MVYLIVILLLYIEPEFINIIRISTNNIYIFRSLISCPNIVYSVIKYKKNEFKRRDIIAVYRLVGNKLKEYPVPAKIIIYSSSITTIQEISSILDYYIYY
jgi:hypothetical protein